MAGFVLVFLLLLPSVLFAQNIARPLLPDRQDLYTPLGQESGYVDSQNIAEQEAALDKIIERNPDNLYAWIRKADIKYHAGELEEADAILKRLAVSFPNRADIKIGRANIAFRQNRYRTAKKLTQDALLLIATKKGDQKNNERMKRDALLLLQYIDKRKNFTPSVKIANIYDSNANNGLTINEFSIPSVLGSVTVPLRENQKPISGWRTQLEPKLLYQRYFSGDDKNISWKFFYEAGGLFQHYYKTALQDFNQQILTAKIGAVKEQNVSSTGFFMRWGDYTTNKQRLLASQSSHLFYRRLLSQKVRFDTALSLTDNDFLIERTRSHIATYGGMGLTYELSPKSLFIFTVGRGEALAREDWESHSKNLTSLSYQRNIKKHGLNIQVSHQEENTDYALANPLFNILREDQTKRATLLLQKTNWRELTLGLLFSSYDQQSSLPIHNAIHKNQFEIFITKKF